MARWFVHLEPFSRKVDERFTPDKEAANVIGLACSQALGQRAFAILAQNVRTDECRQMTW